MMTDEQIEDVLHFFFTCNEDDIDNFETFYNAWQDNKYIAYPCYLEQHGDELKNTILIPCIVEDDIQCKGIYFTHL